MPGRLSRTAVALRLRKRAPPAQTRPALPPQPKPKTFTAHDGSTQIDRRKAQQKPWSTAPDGKHTYLRSEVKGPSSAKIYAHPDERKSK